jgi:GTPase involved in cell partitioning and DNA repair
MTGRNGADVYIRVPTGTIVSERFHDESTYEDDVDVDDDDHVSVVYSLLSINYKFFSPISYMTDERSLHCIVYISNVAFTATVDRRRSTDMT